VRSKQRVTFRFASARRRSSASKTAFIFDLPRGNEDRWGSRGRKPKVFLIRISATRTTTQAKGAACTTLLTARHTTAPSLLRTWKRRGRSDYSSWTHDHPVTVRHTGMRRGWQGSPHRNSYRASTSLKRRWIYILHQRSKPGHGTEGGSVFFQKTMIDYISR
jgi:hypothetical protein